MGRRHSLPATSIHRQQYSSPSTESYDQDCRSELIWTSDGLWRVPVDIYGMESVPCLTPYRATGVTAGMMGSDPRAARHPGTMRCSHTSWDLLPCSATYMDYMWFYRLSTPSVDPHSFASFSLILYFRVCMDATSSLISLGIDFVPVPGLAPAFSILVFIWGVVQKVCAGQCTAAAAPCMLIMRTGIKQQTGTKKFSRFQCRHTICCQSAPFSQGYEWAYSSSFEQAREVCNTYHQSKFTIRFLQGLGWHSQVFWRACHDKCHKEFHQKQWNRRKDRVFPESVAEPVDGLQRTSLSLYWMIWFDLCYRLLHMPPLKVSSTNFSKRSVRVRIRKFSLLLHVLLLRSSPLHMSLPAISPPAR